jgi:sporulation protein YlmC with PRC-barrel domain
MCAPSVQEIVMQPRTIPLAFATGLVTLPAWAQTNPPAPSSNPPTTAAPAQSGQFLSQEKPGQWRASKLRGLDVYNNSNEKIGDIREVLLDQSGKAEAVVIGVGGFLGIGERDVALPFSEVKFVDQPRTASATDTRPAGANAPPTPAAPVPTSGPATTGSATGTRTDTTGSTAGARPDTNRAYPDHAVLNMNKDQLRNAPAFQYAR